MHNSGTSHVKLLLEHHDLPHPAAPSSTDIQQSEAVMSGHILLLTTKR